MSIIFDQQNGLVSRFDENATVTSSLLTILDPELNYTTHRVLILNAELAFNTNYQLTDSLSNSSHLVTFGESVTPLPISGLIFESSCAEGSDSDSPSLNTGAVGYSGVAGVIRWWESNNLSRRQSQIRLTIGDAYPIYAYIANLRIMSSSAAERIWKFELLLLRVPSNINSTPTLPSVPAVSPSLPSQPVSVVPSSGSEPGSGFLRPILTGSYGNRWRLQDVVASDAVPIRTDGSPTSVTAVAITEPGYAQGASVVGQISNT